MKATKKLIVVWGICLTATLTATLAAAGMSGDDATAAASTPAFTQTKTVTRTNVASDGSTSVVATNTVTLNVGDTTDLQGRQEIQVSWSGAHPTGGIVADPTSVDAQYEEYPLVLLECRGVDSNDVNAADQLSPETCWTQSSESRYQQSGASNVGGLYPPYRLDQDASTPGTAVVGPSPLPAKCQGGLVGFPVQYYVPWVAADGTSYYGGNGNCGGEPPEATIGGSALPSNEIYGVTGSDGTGSADFDVFNLTENATLGCSETVACSLVAVPIMGISCDGDLFGPSPTQAELSDLAVCEETGAYAPGSIAGTQTGIDNGDDLTVSGSLWWSPSNWRNRITVPLTFAPLPNACSVVSTNHTISVYGSELMLQATSQWEPNFCLSEENKFSFVHEALGEPQARNQVAAGSAEAAFTSFAQPQGYGKPVVNAPVAVTGFTISYSIDDQNGNPVTTLKLTPLLLAKLLTESYPDLSANQGGDPALAQNPLNITADPEFQALNPGIATLGGGWAAASELLSLSGNSDVIEALTTYINDDPAARAFLDGTPDTSMPGEDMVVNPAYKGISLPVNQWPLLSTYVSTGFDASVPVANCLQNSPQPFYSLIAAPVASLEDVSEDMQYDKANSTTTCSPNDPGLVNSLVANGTEPVGHHFMIGITPLADNQRYNLQSAQLQTTNGTFVAPSDASLKAATDLLTPDATTGTWPIPYAAFETAAGASAYPGTMVVYAAVPTTGLPAVDAVDYASLLLFAATTGQTPGSGVGQLPLGYLPLTQANGLGALADYTVAAAVDVAAQNGELPSMTAGTGESSPATTSTSQSSEPATQPPPSTPTPGSSSSSPPFGSYSTRPFSLIPSLVAGSQAGSGHAAGGQPSKPKAPGILPLGPTLNVALWTGALWTGGFIFVLIFGLALLGVLSVPMAYLAGRKRGRW